MNKRGQVIIVLLMIAITMIIVVLALSPLIKQIVDESRNSNNLDCENASISNFDKTTCVASDMTQFYFIGGMIFLAGSVVTARVLIG
jgi:hypothetical protein